jgi:hypothetical protein
MTFPLTRSASTSAFRPSDPTGGAAQAANQQDPHIRHRSATDHQGVPIRSTSDNLTRVADLSTGAVSMPAGVRVAAVPKAWLTQAFGLPAAAGPNRHIADLSARLLSTTPDAAAVVAADAKLRDAGYKFVGYHGTNHASFMSMHQNGLDPSRLGSNSGTAKGSGFYVSHQPGYAKDWAEAATQAGDPVGKGAAPLKPGDEGVERVTRVYAKNVESMKPGVDRAWGMQPAAGDPNDDKRLRESDTQMRDPEELASKANDLEMVFAPQTYADLAVIPSLGRKEDARQLGSSATNWPSHEAPK